MLSYLNCPKTILLPNRVFHLIAELLKKTVIILLVYA